MHCAVEKMSLQTDKILVLDTSCATVLLQDNRGHMDCSWLFLVYFLWSEAEGSCRTFDQVLQVIKLNLAFFGFSGYFVGQVVKNPTVIIIYWGIQEYYLLTY